MSICSGHNQQNFSNDHESSDGVGRRSGCSSIGPNELIFVRSACWSSHHAYGDDAAEQPQTNAAPQSSGVLLRLVVAFFDIDRINDSGSQCKYDTRTDLESGIDLFDC